MNEQGVKHDMESLLAEFGITRAAGELHQSCRESNLSLLDSGPKN